MVEQVELPRDAIIGRRVIEALHGWSDADKHIRAFLAIEGELLLEIACVEAETPVALFARPRGTVDLNFERVFPDLWNRRITAITRPEHLYSFGVVLDDSLIVHYTNIGPPTADTWFGISYDRVEAVCSPDELLDFWTLQPL